MVMPSSPPQNVPVRRIYDELACNSDAPPFGAHRPSFRGVNHGDGIFASPRDVVGNILSSNLGGSPLSRAGCDNSRNRALIFAHLTIARSDFFNTAITFIQLPPRLGRLPSPIHKMILGHTRCSCRTWQFPLQKQAIPLRCQRPHPTNGPLATAPNPKLQGCLPLCLSTTLLPETFLPRSSLRDSKSPTQI